MRKQELHERALREPALEEPVCIGFDERPCDGGADGFRFAKHADGTPDPTKVVLCGADCERVKIDPGIQIDVVLGCSPLVVD